MPIKKAVLKRSYPFRKGLLKRRNMGNPYNTLPQRMGNIGENKLAYLNVDIQRNLWGFPRVPRLIYLSGGERRDIGGSHMCSLEGT